MSRFRMLPVFFVLALGAGSALRAQTYYSLWPASAVPGTPWYSDTGCTLGVNFQSSVSGNVTGIRFYKGAGNNGTQIGLLYSSSGTLLAQATFTGETSSGWQQVNFSTPVAITANTDYVAAYFSTTGFAYDASYFASTGVNNPPLEALANGAVPNGVYACGSAAQFPSTGYGANYWADVVFTYAGPPAITGLSPSSGLVGQQVTITGSGFGSSQGTSAVTFNGVSAGTAASWSATSIIVNVPSGATTGSVVVTAGGVASNGMTFTVTALPTTTGLSPAWGLVGQQVTITGSGFGSSQGTSAVTFNGVSAGTAASWSAASIIVNVPSGATTGSVVVTTAGGASNGMTFTVASSSGGVEPWVYGPGGTIYFTGGNVGIGTISPQNALSVNGTVQAKQVVVNTAWSDYVFAPDYSLMPLADVAAYIKANQHLPGMPSAAEVEKSGVSVGEVEAKLLEKIEELTLHMIEAQKRNRELERENRDIRGRLARVEAQATRKEDK